MVPIGRDAKPSDAPAVRLLSTEGSRMVLNMAWTWIFQMDGPTRCTWNLAQDQRALCIAGHSCMHLTMFQDGADINPEDTIRLKKLLKYVVGFAVSRSSCHLLLERTDDQEFRVVWPKEQSLALHRVKNISVTICRLKMSQTGCKPPECEL